MLINLFDIGFSCNWRCQWNNFALLLCICAAVFVHHCGIVCGLETIKAIEATATAPSKTAEIIKKNSSVAAAVKKPATPSSAIYIPALDGISPNSHDKNDGTENLHGSEHDIRLEEIFWSGSGDEPLTFSMKSNARLTVNSFVGRETFIKTATVIATVYVGEDSNEGGDATECNSNNCDSDSTDIPDINLPTDKRYWLVTTIAGILNDEEIPAMEERLSQVYRIAFSRQQSIHLGLMNATAVNHNETTEQPANALFDNKTGALFGNEQSTNFSMSILPTSVLKYENAFDGQTSLHLSGLINSTLLLSSMAPETLNVSISLASSTAIPLSINQSVAQPQHRQRRLASSSGTAAIHPTPSNAVQPTQIVFNPMTIVNASQSNLSKPQSIALQKALDGKPTVGKPLKDDKKIPNSSIIGRIDVLIHNISVIDYADKDYFNDAENSLNSHYIENPSSNQSRGADNQTEIVYTVFVNGIPILATIAANDMKLLMQPEVEKIIEKPVVRIAEPYLKEPQATPLIPSATASTSEGRPILATIFQNPYILAFMCALLLLIILLLMILMLVAGSNDQRIKKKGVATKSAQTAQQSFLPPLPRQNNVSSGLIKTNSISNAVDEKYQRSASDVNQIEIDSTNGRQKKQVGTQITSLQDACNYERDHSFIIIPTPLKRKHHHKRHGTPTIYFPDPPSSAPSSPTAQSQSTSSTSDTSSIYYIKKHRTKRQHTHSKRPKQLATLNHREYATITKKQIERAQKKAKHKRKYLKSGSNNRIGTFEETVQVHSSRSSSGIGPNTDEHKQLCENSGADDTFERFNSKGSHLYEHIEAFNPLVGKKKLQNRFTSFDDGKRDKYVATENEMQKSAKRSSKVSGTQTSFDKDVTDAKERKSGKERKTQSQNTHESYSLDGKKMTQVPSDDAIPKGDDLSIGSFLSMASIRSFPKCSVPEPLHRVLEPVSITHLDEYDEIEAIGAATNAAKIPRIVDTKMKKPLSVHDEPTTTVYLSRTRSDGADPGVIGPVAWQLHKKKLEAQDSLKPMREDPASLQSRYEGLLEGAISLYSIETTEYHTVETITKEEFTDTLPKELRGKSANEINLPSKSYPLTKAYRPFTALPSKVSTEDVPPAKGAWIDSSSSLTRPFSADSRQNTPSPFIDPIQRDFDTSTFNRKSAE